MSNTFISPNLTRVKEFLNKDGDVIRKQVQGKDVAAPVVKE